SDASGRNEIYARSFPDPAARVQISSEGGREPVWSADGSRIFYRSANRLMSAKLATTPTLRVVSRDTVVKDITRMVTGQIVGNYDVAKDGRIIGLITSREDYQLIVVPNWLPELQQRLKASRRSAR
ncbi:MAG TPA: hypothetical protein VIF83_10190, partial [Gemmatimonadaceae bacterium]